MSGPKGQTSVRDTYGWLEEQIRNVFYLRDPLGQTYSQV